MNEYQRNFNGNFDIFIQEYAYENVVCEMVAILSSGTWFKLIGPWKMWQTF